MAPPALAPPTLAPPTLAPPTLAPPTLSAPDKTELPPGPAETDGWFSLAVIPDTQGEVGNPADPRYANRTQWLADHKTELNLAYVLHTGDNVDYGWLAPGQYEMAKQAISVLDQAGIPFSLSIGNHDTKVVGWDGIEGSRGYGGSAYSDNPECPERLGLDACKSWLLIRDTAEFNAAFPVSSLTNLGGTYEPNKVDNTWTTFTSVDSKWLVLTLELWPRQDVLTWAEKVVADHPRHNVIIQTHHYLDPNAAVSESNGGYGETAPEALYDAIVSRYSNVKLVFSGHNGGFAKRTDTNDGNTVVSYLGNDLGPPHNPVRVLTIDTNTGTVTGRLHDPISNTAIAGHDTIDTITITR